LSDGRAAALRLAPPEFATNFLAALDKDDRPAAKSLRQGNPS
jgi:hypothetical protein